MATPMRRVTIPVAEEKFDQSLDFYRQVLGQEVLYEAELTLSQQAALLGLSQPLLAKLTVLGIPGNRWGMVGLLRYLKPALGVRQFFKPADGPFPVYFVYSAQNTPKIHERALSLGSRVIRAPIKLDPRDGGTQFRTLVLEDPNGVFCELVESVPDDTGPGRLTIMRRVTIAVPKGQSDSLMAFYRDGIGLQPMLDKVLVGSAERSSLGVGDFKLRIVSLQKGDCDEGMVGLMEYLEPDLEVGTFHRDPGQAHPLTFVFLTDDIESERARLESAGAKLVCPPTGYEMPQHGQAVEMSWLAPNGVLLVFTQMERGIGSLG